MILGLGGLPPRIVPRFFGSIRFGGTKRDRARASVLRNQSLSFNNFLRESMAVSGNGALPCFLDYGVKALD